MAVPTLDLTAIVIGGPCKITDSTTVFYTESDVRLVPEVDWRAIPSSLAGNIDSIIQNLRWVVRFTPKSVYAYNGALCPTAYFNWTVSGARMFGTGNRAVTILGSDGQQYALTRAKVTKVPDIYCGLGKSMWGEVEYTAFPGTGLALNDATLFYTASTGVSWTQTDYAALAAAHQEAICSAAWGAGTGFTKIFAEEGFAISHELATEPVKQGNVTVDFKIVSYRAMVRFKPQGVGLTEALLLAASQFASGSNLGIGTRMTQNSLANCHDFVVTDGAGAGSINITMASMAIQGGEFVFDGKLNRFGEFAFITANTAPGNRLVFAA